jgi:hypothetical protein
MGVVWMLAFGALLLALAYFTWRGVWRAALESEDLAVGYSAGRALILGHDPYDPVVLNEALALAGGGDLAATSLLDRLRNVYLPSTLPAFAPLAVVSWPLARLLFLAINVGATFVIVGGLLRVLGWRPTHPRALAFAAFVLALAPVHTTIASGQSALVATAAVAVGLVLQGSPQRAASGALVGLATILKVQVGLPFMAYLLARGQWRAVLAGTGLVAASGLLAIGWMQSADVPWASSWLRNLAALSGPGGINDPSLLNPERYSLINLQVLLVTLAPGGWVDGITWLLVGGSGVALAWLTRGRRDQELLAVSGVAVLGLLVAYHRYYDAVVLVFPIAWAIAELGGPRHRHGIAVLLLSANFILPFQTAFHDLQQTGRLPDWMGSGFFDLVLSTQHVWALVLITVVLLLAAARAQAEASDVTGTVPDLGRSRLRS